MYRQQTDEANKLMKLLHAELFILYLKKYGSILF